MALIFPMTQPQGTKGGCVGHFVSTDHVHLVSIDGYELVFDQLLPETNHPSVRLPIAVSGQVIGLHRVPVHPESYGSQVEHSTGLDMLLIHTQTIDKNAGKVVHHLTFKLYNPDSQELATISNYTCDGGPSHPQSSTWSSLSVCDTQGPNLGVVAFASGGMGPTTFLNPFNIKGASPCIRGESLTVADAAKSYWVGADLVVISRKRSDQMSYVLEFVKVQRRAKNAKTDYKTTTIDRQNLPPGLSLRGVGLLPFEGSSIVCAVLSDSSVNTYCIKVDSVELTDEKRLDLPKYNLSRSDLSGFKESRAGRSWFTLSSQQLCFVSTDGVVLKVSAPGEFSLFKADGVPEYASLSPLGLNIFKLRTKRSEPVLTVLLSLTGLSTAPKVVVEQLRPVSFEFEGAKLVRHEFNKYFGSQFWFSFKGTLSQYFCRSERTVGATLSSLYRYPFKAPITGMWSMGAQHILVSTAAQTSMYILDDLHLKRVPSEFDANEATVAAAPGIQVTRNTVNFSGGNTINLPLDGVTVAAAHDDQAIVADTGKVIVIKNGRIFAERNFDDIVMDVDIRSTTAAVLLTDSLQVWDLLSEGVVSRGLRDLGTSVSCDGNGRIFAGDKKGGIYVYPNNGYVKVSSTPIKSLRSQHSGTVALAGHGDSVLIDGEGNFSRLPIDDASDVVLNDSSTASTSCGLAIVNGIVRFLSIDGPPTMTPNLIDATKLLHSRPEDVKFWRDYVYSFRVSPQEQRNIQRALFSDMRHIESFELPRSTRTDLTDFQMFILSDIHFLELARKDPDDGNNGSEASDESDGEDDDFNTELVVTLYELQPEFGKAVVLNQKEFTLSGDPYEEVVVKFYSPYDFVIFTHSSSAVSGHVDFENSGALTIGTSTSCFEYLYDDYWLQSSDGGVVVVTFTGEVFRVSPQKLRETEPPVNCFRNVDKNLGSIVDSDGNNDSVFEALRINEFNTGTTSLATTSKGKSTNGISTVALLEVSERLALKVKAEIHDPSLSLVCVSKDLMRNFMWSEIDNKYLGKLMPTVVVGTGRGGAYFVTEIADKEFLSKLLDAQRVLQSSIETIDSPVFDRKDGTVVDGLLLLTALSIREAESLFLDAGLDPEGLRLALEHLVH